MTERWMWTVCAILAIISILFLSQALFAQEFTPQCEAAGQQAAEYYLKRIAGETQENQKTAALESHSGNIEGESGVQLQRSLALIDRAYAAVLPSDASQQVAAGQNFALFVKNLCAQGDW